MANLLKSVLFLVFLALGHLGKGQAGYLHWEPKPPAGDLQENITIYFQNLKDSVPASLWPDKIKLALQKEGHWLSTVSLDGSDSVRLQINPGPLLELGRLEIELPDSLLVPKPLSNYANMTLSQYNIGEQLDYYLNFYEENGYPFAEARLREYGWQNNTLNGKVRIGLGPYITWDSVAIKGFSNFSEATLRYELGFYKGKPYQETYLEKLEAYARQIEFLNFTRPPAVAFFQNKTTLFLYTQEQKGNQVDGVVGLNTADNGETTLNGDFQLRLLNIFKKGEDLQLRWRRPDASIQELDLGINWPFLFKTPVWLSSNFNLFRQDSSFVNTNFNGLLKYRVARQSFIAGGINYRSSNALVNLENPTTTGSAFSSLNSFSSFTYLLGTEINRLNRALVPTAGYQLTVYGKTGERTTENQKQSQLGWQVNSQWLWPFYGNMVAKVGLQSQALVGPSLFENELFRLGGLRSLRGFNEQSIFSSGYAIGTLEYRYMIGPFDYLTLFTDLAFSERNVQDKSTSTWLNGLGTGLNFRTKGGIFSFFLAVGQSETSNFDFRATKVHFGYVNQF